MVSMGVKGGLGGSRGVKGSQERSVDGQVRVKAGLQKRVDLPDP